MTDWLTVPSLVGLQTSTVYNYCTRWRCLLLLYDKLQELTVVGGRESRGKRAEREERQNRERRERNRERERTRGEREREGGGGGADIT